MKHKNKVTKIKNKYKYNLIVQDKQFEKKTAI